MVELRSVRWAVVLPVRACVIGMEKIFPAIQPVTQPVIR